MANAAGMKPTAVEIQGNYIKMFDISISDASKIYIGYAEHGTATSSALWQIREVILDANGSPASLKFANGSEAFDQIWDNRTTLTYS